MRILLTGASSFTGFWIARALTDAGHSVVAALRGHPARYDGIRAERVTRLQRSVELVSEVSFGSEAFLGLAGREPWDLLCHHAAFVTGYRSPEFDVLTAVAENTRQADRVLRVLAGGGTRGVVLTGTVFEPDEGTGTEPRRAFSPYGLSKGMTWQAFAYHAAVTGVPLSKFVVPNPFGPYEEARFCSHVIGCWARRDKAVVQSPRYVRDNIHASLLARCYMQLVASFDTPRPLARLAPSGYAESQGDFAHRLARELGPRLGLEAHVECAVQTDFSEPAVRTNTDRPDALALGWDEARAWDEMADFYRPRLPAMVR